ncbi:tRNA (guanosine(46)-N7)-methyltransferase TrmB [Roseivirga misakiensis]|uniref:tRNA (guanine-N(7)-)-methyltransferase n=1 Tax=Roseivirga misakiensis TaxID=1563681 RepID=A0A1E5SZT7_9BACT|nr:tRNA (guanosine(46)-N7)-methyltransferase TrmB [Roseivirga misakiensis]OEK04644.1 tRNA (guanosine(46)-N7)-methyltransferase TrmB [Roseivirga misakiensis]
MPRGKKKRFQENKELPNIIQEGSDNFNHVKGQWAQHYFKNDYPITVEMGCGKGEYTVGLARYFKERNFVGVDIKGDRLWVGSKLSVKEKLENVAFLRTLIHHINDFFETDEVDNIWITFPDPRPRDRDEKRRLTSPRFLEHYKDILKPNGQVFFKTDNTGLFEYTLEVLKERTDILDLAYTFDLYQSEYLDDHYGIKTNFEQKYLDLGEPIKYLKFRFKP